jgi:putative transcriptional regulator
MTASKNNIRALRERLGLSQAQLGELTGGAHWVTVSRWERGKLKPNASQQGLLGKFDVASRCGPGIGETVAKEMAKPLGFLMALYFLLKVADEVEKNRERESEPK